MGEGFGAALGRIAASTDPLPARAATLLAFLRTAIPFDGAWLGFVDGHDTGCASLASIDLDDHVVEHLAGHAGAGGPAPLRTRDAHRSGLSNASRTDPCSVPWSGRLNVVGYRASLRIDLFARGRRRVGVLVLLYRHGAPTTPATRRRLMRLAPVIAIGIDPMRCLVATARTVQEARAGTVLRDDGSTESLPGLPGDPLLAVGSVPLEIARRHLAEGARHASFLWPLGGPHAPDGHARMTVVVASEDLPDALIGVVLISPEGHLCGLTPRELEVIGLIIDGRANREIASALVVSPRTIAAHIEHVLAKLDASSRTQAAVQAERAGLYVPAGRSPRVGCTSRPDLGAAHSAALLRLGPADAGPVRCSVTAQPRS